MESFSIIRFTPQQTQYAASAVVSDFVAKYPDTLGKEYVDFRQVQIPTSASRIGGPVVDLPPGVSYPDDYFFVAQLDLGQFSKHDKAGLLPGSGFLHVFTSHRMDKCIVIFADCPANSLQRVIREHGDQFFTGRLVQGVFQSTETFDSRYSGSGPTLEWDPLGTEVSKMFGIYTNCQLSEKEIRETTGSRETLLLQIGAKTSMAKVCSAFGSKPSTFARRCSKNARASGVSPEPKGAKLGRLPYR